MEEQTTWKGHSFTLLIFTGIVVLSSIFFILGMLVGRMQGQKIAIAAAEASAIKNMAKEALPEDKPELTFFESVENEKRPALEPLTTKAAPAAPEPPRPAESVPPGKVLNFQIAALRKSSDADKLLNDVKKKGFRGFILAPARGDVNPYFRVQVGPLSSTVEAEDVKKRLLAAGYQPILKK